jgi:hypothetical protein
VVAGGGRWWQVAVGACLCRGSTRRGVVPSVHELLTKFLDRFVAWLIDWYTVVFHCPPSHGAPAPESPDALVCWDTRVGCVTADSECPAAFRGDCADLRWSHHTPPPHTRMHPQPCVPRCTLSMSTPQRQMVRASPLPRSGVLRCPQLPQLPQRPLYRPTAAGLESEAHGARRCALYLSTPLCPRCT